MPWVDHRWSARSWGGRGAFVLSAAVGGPSPPPLPLPFPKLRSSCSPQRGPRAATLQFGEGKGEGRGAEADFVAQNAADEGAAVICSCGVEAPGF